MPSENQARQDIIDACLSMNATGLNQGTSGNVSIRVGGRMLITPSAVPYDQMTPEMLAAIDLTGDMAGAWDGPRKPSTEWRFHWQLLKSRADINAIVHAHPTYCTAFAMLRQPIPASHYMVAAFGGADVRCAGYDTFGTAKLADLAVEAMTDRFACLLANHGMIAGGESIAQAMWRAEELETLARQYCIAKSVGNPVILTDAQIDKTLEGFKGYGLSGD